MRERERTRGDTDEAWGRRDGEAAFTKTRAGQESVGCSPREDLDGARRRAESMGDASLDAGRRASQVGSRLESHGLKGARR